MDLKSKSKFRYPNNGNSNDEFQILLCLTRPKQRILKSGDFKSMYFKSMDFKSKCCHPNIR